jgi:hypothetical protein
LAHKSLNKRQRAIIAAEIVDGAAWLVPTQSQAATILGVNSSYVRIARSLSPSRRMAILRGEDQTSFAVLSARLAPRLKVARGNGHIDDAALINLVQNIGVDRLLTAAIAVERGA